MQMGLILLGVFLDGFSFHQQSWLPDAISILYTRLLLCFLASRSQFVLTGTLHGPRGSLEIFFPGQTYIRPT